MQYYYEVEKFSNIYACQIGLGGLYGHGFKTVNISEFFSWWMHCEGWCPEWKQRRNLSLMSYGC